ncbi:S53 family peptidase [Streptacidiphilus rugosus]|uniref:S53 family peptidase n=1 Tax=Streptacidiphilus rugosus TaxID=405783 RepID=UPI00069239DC|nr:S53 family peptidase [Streptacidiphilus rugosus]
MTEQHVLLAGSERPVKHDARRVRDAGAKDSVSVTVSLRGAGLDENPEQRRADADKTKAVLERFGLRSSDESKIPQGSLGMTGTVEAMNKAFQTDLGIYHSDRQGDFRGREGELKIPADLQGIVTGVFGLDQRRMARRASFTGHGAFGSLSPADLEQRYNFPGGDGGGQHVAIAEFGGGYLDADTEAFTAKHHLPQAQVDVVELGYTPPRSWQEIQQMPRQDQQAVMEVLPEVMMDVQIVAGLVPAAQISVYFTNWDQKGWIDLLDQALADKPVALSISYGLPEDDPDWADVAIAEIEKRLSAAAQLGITVCVSSGDDGSGDQMSDGRCHVNYPAASPSTLAVGGTMINGGDEEAWWVAPGDRAGRGGATGGGVSVLFDRPDWQHNVRVQTLNPGAKAGRVVPDVAALAGPPYYDLILHGRPRPNGGTSASAPLWAALITRINAQLPAAKRQRFLTPLLYQNGASAAMLDIGVGHDNASFPQPGVGYAVQKGYDACTGLGVPDGTALLAALQ